MGAAAANESSVPVVPVLEDLFTKAQVCIVRTHINNASA
jgi:hypothetical protein